MLKVGQCQRWQQQTEETVACVGVEMLLKRTGRQKRGLISDVQLTDDLCLSSVHTLKQMNLLVNNCVFYK